MHRVIVVLVFFNAVMAFAMPKQVKQFSDQIKTLKNSWSAKTDLKKKTADLKVLKSDFDSTILEYQKENPVKGNSEEEKVLSLFYAMEPLFILIDGKVDTETCEQALHRIKMEDSYQDDGKLSANAQTAHDLTKLICKK
jgi:hypothetical protein